MTDEAIVGWTMGADVREALRVERALAAFHQGDAESAVLEIEELLDDTPHHAEGLFLLGEALIEVADFGGAALSYDAYHQVAPPSPASLSGLAIARFNQCDLEGALEATHRALHLAPDLAEAHYTRALVLERHGSSPGDAEAHFRRAFELDPETYPLPLQLPMTRWSTLLESALSRTHPAVSTFWRGLPVHLEQFPDLNELRRVDPPIPPTVTGLYSGAPPSSQASDRSRPTALRLFVGNLIRCPDEDHLLTALIRTLEGESSAWGVRTDDG